MSYDTAHTLAVVALQKQGGVVIDPAGVTVLRMKDGTLRAVVDLIVDEKNRDRVATVRLTEEASFLDLLNAMATGSE